MPCRSDTIRVDDIEVHLLRGGRGEPLLVLHSEFASGRWFPYHDDLAQHFHVLAPDHPGFGKTPRPEWLDRIDDFAIFYADFLRACGWERVRMLGLSFGGWIAAEFASLFPERVSHLVLVGAGGLKVEGESRFDLFAQPFEETLQHLFFAPDRWLQLMPTEPGTELILRTYREATTLARVSWNPYWYNPKLERRLRRIRCPTLVVWGAEDRFLSPAHARAFAASIPTAELVLLPRCGHLPPLECQSEFIGHVLPFLQR
ncbi:MAG: alpha/beta hydrolase [Candidatus Binatia bacterium]|nr:alpha/beta hydrolase [Candidatus Binatia bacterium]